VRQQNILSRLVEREVARAGPAGRYGIQQPQVALRRIDGERTHGGGLVQSRPQRKRIFAHCVQKLVIRMNGQKRGINHFRRQPGFAHFAGGRMKTADIDPFAQAASRGRALLHIFESGIGAEVYEVVTVSGLRSQGTGRKECGQQRRYIDDQPVPTEHSRFLGFHWLSHPAAFTITSSTSSSLWPASHSSPRAVTCLSARVSVPGWTT